MLQVDSSCQGGLVPFDSDATWKMCDEKTTTLRVGVNLVVEPSLSGGRDVESAVREGATY